MRVNGIVVHHSDSPRDTTKMETIRKWHLAKGWADIGYHYVIEGDGKLRVGRRADQVGAHCLGHNSDPVRNTYTLGICLTGNFETEDPSEEQIHNLIQLLATLCRRHNLKPEQIYGHSDLYPTACPGYRLRTRLAGIRRNVGRYLVQKG
jgi:N-acetyl-anhydromuramyl-L-alanine amidase AmpD